MDKTMNEENNSNVYDIVADFYDNDEGWNQILQRTYAEGFLRKEAWRGLADEKLQEEWGYIVMLCIYVGHTETFLGDLTSEDIIDLVAWCGRNVSEFHISSSKVADFLEVLSRFFAFLKNKKAIVSASAFSKAKDELLNKDNELQLIATNGEFLPNQDFRAQSAADDLPVKVFLDINEMLQDLLDELHIFFKKPEFQLDLERGVFFYYGIIHSQYISKEMEDEEFWQCFWDYFLFDYHLIINDKTPLEHFYCENKESYTDLLEELLRAKLVAFTVEGFNEDGISICKDFITGEVYYLSIPVDEEVTVDDGVFIGHIFYNKTMIMNCIYCLQFTKLARKKFLANLKKCYAWYQIQEQEGTWEDFIARNPMVLRHLAYIYSNFIKLDGFHYETKVEHYKPQAFTKPDEVINCLAKMMETYHFTSRDIFLAVRMWQDYLAQTNITVRKPDIWAAGIIENFIKLNAIYTYSTQNIVEMCWQVPLKSLQIAANKIKEQLAIEDHDPRYSNEEGFLMMLFK